MSRRRKILTWLYQNRTSARLALLFRLLSTAISAVMSLVWTPLLVARMGDQLYGLFMSFAAIPRLGGLGDMGISGAIAVRTGQMLGRGENERLRSFLAAARALILISAPVLSLIFFALSPWIPGWLHFENAAGAGSLTLLFQTGAVFLLLMLGGGYVYAVNSGYGNVLWPILPLLLLSQAGLFGHWLLACAQTPLWVQNLPYVASSALSLVMVWWLLKRAHPWLAELRPIKIDLSIWKELLATSGWVYLYSLGYFIFTMTDRLLINAGIGPEAVPPYMFNYKPCELALQVVAAACVATQAKINQWISNPAEESQLRVRRELQRLCTFQNYFGITFALGYIAFNNLFIDFWVGDSYRSSGMLQLAFALTLVITAGGDAGIQTAAICGPKGLRTAGLAIGIASLLNFVLSFIAMRVGSVVGIAFATVIAQTGLSLFLSWHSCRHLKLPFLRWGIRSWLLPVSAVAIATLLQSKIGSNTLSQAVTLAGLFLVLAVIFARLLGINRDFFQKEISILQGFFRR